METSGAGDVNAVVETDAGDGVEVVMFGFSGERCSGREELMSSTCAGRGSSSLLPPLQLQRCEGSACDRRGSGIIVVLLKRQVSCWRLSYC